MSKENSHVDYIEFPAKSMKELNAVKDFFTRVFGWSCQQWGDDYADTKGSGVGSGINAKDSATASLPVIYVADIQATYNEVKVTGAPVTKEIFDFPGGKRFHFQDPAGNELAAWSE